MLDYFDRVVVLTLKRRADRLAEFWQSLEQSDWPFKRPTVHYGVDGQLVPVPSGWNWGSGTWGCLQSWRQILEQALMDRVQRLLCLEDDARFCEGFGQKATSFLKLVGDDWDGLFFGGQHLAKSLKFKQGVRLCVNCQRTHAFAVQGRYMRDLYRVWISSSGHADHLMGPTQPAFQVLCPERFLVAQGANQSDICGSFCPAKDWNENKNPIVLLRADRETLVGLRPFGLHNGYWRLPDERDAGLCDLMTAPENDRPKRMKEFLSMICKEAGDIQHGTPCVWHDDVPLDLVKNNTQREVREITARSVEEGRKKIWTGV